MRKYKAFIILLLIPFISLAQSGVLEWAHSAGNAQDITRGNDIATDSNGNVYTIGEFRNDVDFDPSDNDFTMSTNGGIDIFIQKLDSNGNFIWAKHVGGDGNDVGSSIAAVRTSLRTGHRDDAVENLRKEKQIIEDVPYLFISYKDTTLYGYTDRIKREKDTYNYGIGTSFWKFKSTQTITAE